MSAAEHTLVIMRHGHSEWNLANRFTGWSDIPLTETGLNEATIAGKRLSDAGFHFDEVHTSVLHRNRQTADSLLAAAGHPEIPILTTWRLNERHYGQLQGMNKQEIFTQWGEEQAQRWWRGYLDPPPPLPMDDPRHPRFDPLYQELEPHELPASESLAQCQARLLPYWQQAICTRIRSGSRLLIIGHGNTLRGLRMHIENIGPEEIEQIEIPMAIPLVYRLDSNMAVIAAEWLE